MSSFVNTDTETVSASRPIDIVQDGTSGVALPFNLAAQSPVRRLGLTVE
jgi:hypothetical protein